MDISPINITNMLPAISSTNEDLVKKSLSKNKDESVVFDEVMNKILTKELLKPLFSSSLISGNQQVGMLMQDTLIDFFNQNLKLVSFNYGETQK